VIFFSKIEDEKNLGFLEHFLSLTAKFQILQAIYCNHYLPLSGL